MERKPRCSNGFGFVLRVAGVRFRISCFKYQIPGFCFRVSGLGFRASGFGGQDFVLRFSGTRFRVSGFGIRDSGFGYQVLGTRFRVSGVGLWEGGPHFGLRAFHHESIYLTKSTSGLDLMTILSRNTPQFKGNEPLVLHRAGGRSPCSRTPQTQLHEHCIVGILVHIHNVLVLNVF